MTPLGNGRAIETILVLKEDALCVKRGGTAVSTVPGTNIRADAGYNPSAKTEGYGNNFKFGSNRGIGKTTRFCVSTRRDLWRIGKFV